MEDIDKVVGLEYKRILSETDSLSEESDEGFYRRVDGTCATFVGLLFGGSMVYSLICDNPYLDTMTYVKHGSLYLGVGAIIGFGVSRIASMIERRDRN